MSRRKLTLLSVTAAVLLAAILMGSVWFSYFTGIGGSFTLPPPLPLNSSLGVPVSDSLSGLPSYKHLSVNADNIQTLLSSIQRPEAYSQTIECVSYWQDGESKATHQWSSRSGLVRVETRQGSTVQNCIALYDRVYVWTGSGLPYYIISPDDMDAESISGIPTWENVAALPRESVVSAEYLYLPDGQCLRVVTRDSFYTAEYYVSLNTGLLISAAYTDPNGNIAFRCTTTPPVLQDPGDSVFTLPDGQLVTQ